jgi:arsenate reductase
MSEALFSAAADGRHLARSAGTTPAVKVHPEVVEVMRDEGVDLSGRRPQALTNELAEWADIVVTMGCGDACPVLPGKKYIDWDLEDPAGQPIGRVREIRDEIKDRVEVLARDL